MKVFTNLYFSQNCLLMCTIFMKRQYMNSSTLMIAVGPLNFSIAGLLTYLR